MFDGFGILYAKQTQFRVSPGRDIEETVMPDAVTEASWAQWTLCHHWKWCSFWATHVFPRLR